MSAYTALARFYDALTGDVPYRALADAYEGYLHRPGRETMTLLDLCCGTGTLTCLLAGRGHELIGVDASPEMLSVAREKAEKIPAAAQPLFLCQEAAELDLYGTVEGAYCALDSMNYLPPETLPALFQRLHLFIEPGGRFAFDIQSPERLRSLDGEAFVDEGEDLLCLWRAAFDGEENALVYGMDIFRREKNALWRRETEEHIEYAHEPRALRALLEETGFAGVRIVTDGVEGEQGRVFLAAENLGH